MTSTITDEQIQALRREALAAGDYKQVDLCDRALADEQIDQDGNEIANAEWSREEAREECARVIADAAADPDDRLEVTESRGVLGLRDPEGGVWWPTEGTSSESELWASYNSGRGEWHS